MVYRLTEQAEKHWQRLNKHDYITLVAQGVQFVDGVPRKSARE
jgi:hypothetical protein